MGSLRGAAPAAVTRTTLNRKIAEQVVDDPRMPHDPITLPELAHQVCLEEDSTANEAAVRARMKLIQAWAAQDDFPSRPSPTHRGSAAEPDLSGAVQVVDDQERAGRSDRVEGS